MMRHRRVAAAVAAVLVACACSGAAGTTGTAAAPDPDVVLPTAPAVTEPPAPELAPLTGLPVATGTVASRAALVVKIDNNDDHARPQSGLNQADVVYEEM